MKNQNEINEITHKIIGAAIEVHRVLGPGLLESAYEQCLATELTSRGLRPNMQQMYPLLQRIHEAQILTYMRLAQCPIGLLFNFNVPQLVQGLKRLIIDIKNKT